MTTGKKLAVLQPNYIPWKGYFDMIRCVDEFIFLDDVLYSKNDWRNRNLIKTTGGVKWLTIPVIADPGTKLIRDTCASGQHWRSKHWMTLVHSYSKAPHFEYCAQTIKELYLDMKEDNLCKINIHFIKTINTLLGITTHITLSSGYNVDKSRSGRLLDLCKATGATTYVTGPAAKNYLDESMFLKHGIDVEWFDYSGYPEYHQLFPPFDHKVSILDLLFNEGPNANQYMKTC